MRESTMGVLVVFGAAAGFGTIGIFGKGALAIDLALSPLLPVGFVWPTSWRQHSQWPWGGWGDVLHIQAEGDEPGMLPEPSVLSDTEE